MSVTFYTSLVNTTRSKLSSARLYESQIKKQVDSVASQKIAAEQELKTVNQQLSSLNETLTTAQKELTDLQSELVDAEQHINTAATKKSEIARSIDQIDSKITTLTNKLTGLVPPKTTYSCDNIHQDLASLSSQIQDINEAYATIPTLTAQLGSLDTILQKVVTLLTQQNTNMTNMMSQ